MQSRINKVQFGQALNPLKKVAKVSSVNKYVGFTRCIYKNQ